MELASSTIIGVIGVLGILVGFRRQERSTVRRNRHVQQAQQRAELRAAIVRSDPRCRRGDVRECREHPANAS